MRGRMISIGFVVVVIALVVVQLFRPVSSITLKQASQASFHVPESAGPIQWPAHGEAALAVAGVGLVGSHGEQKPMAIASVAKLMTANLVLTDHPLTAGHDGPTVTITQADVKEYEHDVATNQSCVAVRAGEKLTERQLLEALLLPSANNAANILARWDAKSTSAFVAKMNAKASSLGMTNTHYSDASGVHAATVSTAVDQLKIAELDMSIPVFVHTVAMKQVTLPVAGIAYNVDYALGHNGIVGIKTGSTDQAGGCFVFATRPVVAGKHVLLIGAVLGQRPNQSINSELMVALSEGQLLSKQGAHVLTQFTPVALGTPEATLSAPWGSPVSAVASKGGEMLGWPGMTVTTKFTAATVPSTIAIGQQVGTLEVTAGKQVEHIPVEATGSLGRPTVVWKLERVPFVTH